MSAASVEDVGRSLETLPAACLVTEIASDLLLVGTQPFPTLPLPAVRVSAAFCSQNAPYQDDLRRHTAVRIAVVCSAWVALGVLSTWSTALSVSGFLSETSTR